ncbi:hypothetical protein AB0E75_10540 [Streptomyces griseoviridis]|uniref:Uncharacterized protein n=1 Tax=Streptomyces griseoviridis TaxID=45398 RepID=A0A918GJX2_STRGD|nr:hypothetical protein [Streptomyces niveoruber]GGS41725.1 hypothetical protein GCM10010238_34140 [Streptomyces niveoruber]
MGAGRWEEALEGFTADKVVTREDVTGMTWLGAPRVILRSNRQLVQGKDYDLTANYQMPDGTLISVGVNLAHEMWAEDSPLGAFWRQTWNILGPVASTPTGNTAVKYGSFDTAADSLERVLALLTAQHDRLITWGNQIDEDDSPAQGSAAGAFKAALTAIAGQLENLRHQVLAQGDPVALIRAAGAAARLRSWDLASAYEAWRPKPVAVPYNVLNEVWQEVTTNYSLGYGSNADVTSLTFKGYGNAADEATMKQVEALAKTRWTQGLTELDTAAVTHVRSLGASYQQAVQAIPASLIAPRYRTPYQEPSTNDPGSDDTTSDDTVTDDITTDDPPSTTPETGSEDSAPDVGTLGAYEGTGAGTGDGTSSPPGTGSTDLGNGVKLPANGTQEIVAPGGGTLTDSEGNPVTLPAGSVINPGGTVTKPGGGLLTDGKGNVVRLPSGSSLGSALVPGVRRNSATAALAAQEAAQEAAYQRALKNARASSGALGEALAPAAAKGAGITGATRLPGATAAQLKAATTSTEGLTAIPGTAPKETPVTGRTATTSTNGPTAMPPGTGMGAGGAPGGRDRDRRTWLDEDEETWGTTQVKGTGVIG